LSSKGELVGGETGMIDIPPLGHPYEPAFEIKKDQDGHDRSVIKHGIVVEPVRGRLVLFTGGGENFHSPLSVKAGKRKTYHAWIECASGGHALKGT